MFAKFDNQQPRSAQAIPSPRGWRSVVSDWLPNGLVAPSVVAIVGLIMLGQLGCRHIGPSTIVADRLPYNEAIATSWKEQTLLNIVKLRYADAPFFVDVAQIVSGYTREQEGTTSIGLDSTGVPPASFGDRLLGVLGHRTTFSDRPTISYAPQTGSQFIRNLTTAIEPSAILFLIEQGYAADTIMELAVESINGVKNRRVTGGEVEAGDLDFQFISQTLRRAQKSGTVGMRIEQDKDKRQTVVLFFHDQEKIDPALAADTVRLRQILHLDPAQHEFHVVFGAVQHRPDEIAIVTRSIIRILSELSSHVDVPPSDIASGRAIPYVESGPEVSEPRIAVRYSCEKPECSFATVCYRGHWFWIDDCDLRSKATFSYLMVFLALSDTGPREGLPLVTIQAN